MCVESQLRESSLKNVDRVPHSLCKSQQLVANSFPFVNKDVFNNYLQRNIRLETYVVWNEPSRTLNLEPQEVILAVEKVAVKPIVNGRAPSLRHRINLDATFKWNHTNYSQPSMPVKSGEVVNVFESDVQTPIRITDRFFSRIRLYGLQPIFKVLREWKFVQCTLLEIPIGTVEDREIQTICCIGGRLGSLYSSDRFPNQTIKRRSELIHHLAEYESQTARNGLDVCNEIGRGLEKGDMPPGSFILTKFGSRAFLLREGIPFANKGLSVNVRPIESPPTILKSS